MENNNDYNIIDFNSAEKSNSDAVEETVAEVKNEETKKTKNSKFSKLHISSKETKIIAALCIILALLITGITTCAIKDINPISYMASIITNDKAHLIGKWQSQEAPGLSAYEFHEDGTYDSYISSFKFKGEYETKGDRLILKSPGTNIGVEYKYSVRGDVFTMTLYKENSAKVKDKKTFKFDKVDSLNQKTIADMLGANSKDVTQPAQ